MAEASHPSQTSVQLDDNKWSELFENIDLAEKMIPGRERRNCPRFDYQTRVTVYAEFEAPLGGVAAAQHGAAPRSVRSEEQRDPGAPRHLVRTRNVSASGLGFIHHSEVVVGTRVSIIAYDKDQQPLTLRGASARADLIEQGVWDIGIEFDESIDPRQFSDAEGQSLASLS